MTTRPSLISLRLLAAVAQHANLSVAAAKLGVTQSAASRRIAALETDLGVILLRRHRRGVDLTDSGARYLAAIAPALETIAQATNAIRARDTDGSLRLRVYATFAARWLLPRLPDFQARHPEINVQIDTTVTPVSFERDQSDLAIQFGAGYWPGTTSQLLIEDTIQPVCTPGFAQANDLVTTTTSLAGLRLLESRYRGADWRDWAAVTQCSLDGAAFMRFSSSLLTYQAAKEGMGLAMGQTRFLTAELQEGGLVAPFASPLKRKLGYYLIAPMRPEQPSVREFRRWILRQTD